MSMDWINTDARAKLYVALVREFGPYREWTKKYWPSSERRQEYLDFLDRMAQAFTTIYGCECSAEAIDQQIAWAVSGQEEVKSKGQSQAFIMNKAAAMKYGFINSGDLTPVILDI